MHIPKLLDCTLRDGSYAVDFQFTTTDTENIVQELDDAGFPYIEIGHGIGLGASARGKNIAAASDTDYMKAAVNSIKKSKLDENKKLSQENNFAAAKKKIASNLKIDKSRNKN